MTVKVCSGGCGRKFNVPADIEAGIFFASGVCKEDYEQWAKDQSMCFGKGQASKANETCQQCSELDVCLEWSKGDTNMKQVPTEPQEDDIIDDEPAAPAEPAAAPAAAAPAQPAEKKKKKGKAKKAAAAPAPAPAPKAQKTAKPAKAPKAEKKTPYRAGSGLEKAFLFLMSGYRTPEEVTAHVGAQWKNPDFLKTTSLLSPGPDKPWVTKEKGGKYRIEMK